MEDSNTPANAPGGGGTSVVGSLDLSTRKDCGLLRKASRRWNISDRFKQRAPAALEWALDQAQSEGDYKAVAFIVNTGSTLEGQNQKDDHLEAKIAAENTNEQDTVTTVVVQRVSRNALIPSGDGNAPALPRGPVADDRQRPTLQRGDVRATVGQDDDGRVPSV